MNTSLIRTLVLSVTLGATSVLAATINFTNSSDVNTAFPTGNIQGGASFRDYSSTAGGSIQLHAQGSSTDFASITTNAYSASSFSSSLDFISEQKTITFNNVKMDFASSGTSYNFAVGIGNAATGNFTATSGPSQSIYFMINRASTTTVDLIQRNGSTFNTLASFTLSNSTVTFANFDALSLTLTGTTWSASVSQTGAPSILTQSGNLATALSSSNWGSSFVLGLQATQTSTTLANISRFTDGYVGSIDIQSAAVPEPSSVAFLTGASALVLCAGRRMSRRDR